MLEAKVEMMIRPGHCPNSSWKASPMVRSEGVKPSRSALVLSDISSITPWFPKCERRAMSVGLPSTGVWSILKSPEWITMPTGVWIASAVVSGILCATWMNSTLKGPSSTTSPALISRKSTCSASLCSRSLFLMKPMFSSYSSAIMLRPISPKPPRGMARSLGCLAKKGELLLLLGNGRGEGRGDLAPLLDPVEVGLDGLEVLLQRAHQEAVIQGRGGVVHGNVAHAVLDNHFAMKARDRLIPRQQARQRVPAKHQHDFRFDQSELLLEIRRAGLRLGGLRIPGRS